MARNYLDIDSPIAAPATPPGQGAIAVVRVTGKGSIELAARCFSGKESLAGAAGSTLRYGAIVDPGTGAVIDRGIVSVFRAPHSFTGEDSVEFSCHGSPAVTDRLMRALDNLGFARALPGEFTFRAFLKGKADLVEAEAVDELARASCEAAREDALLRLGGALSRKFAEVRRHLLDLLAEMESRLDYPDEEGPDADEPGGAKLGQILGGKIAAAILPMEELSSSYTLGRLRKDGVLVVVAGRPNAGKSSLFNLMVREERAIVSPEPGTTRDWLEAWIELDGLALRLIDTAGLRHAAGQIEAEGVRRAEDMANKADVILYLVDGGKGLGTEDEEFLERHRGAIRIWNKTDNPECGAVPEGWIPLSAKSGEHLRNLEEVLGKTISTEGGSRPGAEGVRIANARQKGLVDRGLAALRAAAASLEAGAPLDAIAPDLRDAADALGEITGEISGDEVFERIFGTFCLGK